MENDFFIGTKESYMALWRSNQHCFFFRVHHGERHLRGHRWHRHHERHVGERDPPPKRDRRSARRWPTQRDILRQFMLESVIQCIAGGIAGISMGFLSLWSCEPIRLPRFRPNVGGGPGSISQFWSRIIFRDLSGDTRIAAGSVVALRSD